MADLRRLTTWFAPFYLFWLTASLGVNTLNLNRPGNDTSGALQDLVTWDEYTIKVRGERVVFLSGEVHPFRLPSPGLWLDVFQKIKAMGFTGVSFYVMWALLEGEKGEIRADGVFELDEFFKAASEAGIYLLARPGPYINAEVSGGGFPGWAQRTKGVIRTSDPDFLDSTRKYLAAIGSSISKAQITNGGPIILVQPENEYTICAEYNSPGKINACLDRIYMASIESQLRDAGVVVPFLSNDAVPLGNFAPGTGLGEVDIYGLDDYPFQWGSGCSAPSNWSRGTFPLVYFNYSTHMQQSPSSPFAVPEYQGGSLDPWGGVGVESCATLVNHEFARVFNKIMYGIRVTILNIYMIFGGTNWGNLGHQNGYTSYDVGAAIKENREITREKYSELKLQGNFLRVSPGYATGRPEDGSYGLYTDTSAVVVTPVRGSTSGFYVVRHSDHKSLGLVKYKWKVATSVGNLTIPQLGGSLSLHGRDSKIHVTDYPLGHTSLVYSSAEIFSWATRDLKDVLILYGGAGETHEFAIRSSQCPDVVEGPTVKCQLLGSLAVIQWDVQRTRRILSMVSGLEVLLLWRNEAYNYWTLDLRKPEPIGLYSSTSRVNTTDSTVIVKAGYLMRSASISGNALYLTGDINATTDIEVVAAPITPTQLFFNGKELDILIPESSRVKATIKYERPNFQLPDLSKLVWSYMDSLPEIDAEYDDSKWTSCVLTRTENTRNLTTPMSLYAGDYGYHAGSLIYRGHFTATGAEASILLSAQGGNGFGYSVWLNSTYLGAWTGSTVAAFRNQAFQLPFNLHSGEPYVITVLIDHMGLHDNWEANGQSMREPRGILDYSIDGHPDQSAVSWKMTGNLGGESYIDHSRGPLNEGSMFAERKGYHLPGAPTYEWLKRSPLQGLDRPGVGFFATNFSLAIPEGYDVPISLVLPETSSFNATGLSAFRLQLFVNGWQLGKYVSNLGPQNRFVLPEGILNHNGVNYLALTFWSLESFAVGVGSLKLEVDAVIYSGYKKPGLVHGEIYYPRSAAY
ncbi:glycoside hydrolase family 35 protein [Xylaria telfairii]|nr:glycoside hydrolase family 35 protein [Xylaria telfairii]